MMRCVITADVVSLVHGVVARAGAVGTVTAYAQSWNDTRWSVLFDDGQGVALNGARPHWPVDGWAVAEGDHAEFHLCGEYWAWLYQARRDRRGAEPTDDEKRAHSAAAALRRLRGTA